MATFVCHDCKLEKPVQTEGKSDTSFWIAQALAGGEVWNIGQLDRETVRELDRFVRSGQLTKSRRSWGNISNPKTVWHLRVPMAINGEG